MANRKKQKNNYVVILAAVVLAGFFTVGFVWLNKGRDSLYREAYINVIHKDKELARERTVGNILYSCLFIPAEYNAVSRLKRDITPEKLVKAVDNSLGFLYFKLSLQSTDEEHPVLDPVVLGSIEYNSRLRYFNAYAQDRIRLLYGADTLKCTQYIFENPYNLRADVKLMLAFKINEKLPARDVQLIYDDQLFNSGPVKFTYDYEQLRQLPELNINE